MQSVGNGNRAVVYDGKIAGLYDLEETLGSGHFAVVKLARHVFTGEKVAVKVIDKTKLDEVSRAHLFQEVRCMKLVQHPNVVRLYEVIDTQTKLYLILELGDGGDLYDYIMKHEGGLSENVAREYFRQIVRAISYCHQLHVVHRDLKPENVVFFEKLGVVKLTDFGFSNKFCPGQKLETSCGSLAYSAPEILLGDSYDAPAVDIWSLGVILYMLVCGVPPFEKANDSETLTMIMDCKYTMPAHVSSSCRRLISAMLVREPEKRATLQQIAQDPWLTQGPQQQQDIVPEFLPLVSRQQVSEEDHTLIIQKIVNGNIATKEEILDALDRNEYNHITATYFLLAERKLRQHRQEQIQKRRPELSLPVSSASRLSPRSRIQGIKRDAQAAGDSNNHLLVPTSSQLTAPRTPGAETTTGGRIRKCSIVQEEEDDEDEMPNSSGRDELSTPLNRRGSRSEGRINITVQDRVTESERLKKDTSNVPSKGLANIGGVKLVNKDTNNVRNRLGMAGIGRTHLDSLKIREKIAPKICETSQRSNSVDQNSADSASCSSDITQTKILIDSSTITIPITSGQSSIHTSTIPKYKTMPSPTRPNAIITGPRALNEIFEEGTDIGSSDTSATTTPRPVARNAHFTSNRTSNNNPSTATRRSKFHKTRTPSCSSSDASDDDSESRKKRAHKINDVVKPIQQQRRDSHDDSSDSQDQGNASAAGGNTSCSTYLLCSTNVGTNNTTRNASDSSGQSGGGSTTTQQQQQHQSQDPHQHQQQQHNQTATSGRQKTDQQQQLGFNRRHRAGRRRAGETRLRESQSLNRITEVQESELPSVMNSSQSNNTVSSSNTTITNHHSNSNRRITMAKNTSNNNNNNNQILASGNVSTTVVKPKGFSARFFQGFIRKSEVIQTPLSETVTITTDPPTADDEVDMVLGVELTKALRASETKSSSATKKLKMLGRYFQVHKKLCIPLPGLFQRGRLYKAQSCGSIVRDKINPNVHANPATTRHSVLFTEKGKILRNCLGARFLGSSDGDINQNQGKGNNMPTNLLLTMSSMPGPLLEQLSQTSTTSTSIIPPSPVGGEATSVAAAATRAATTLATTPLQNFNLPRKKTSSPLHHLNDVPLCSSKC